MKIKLNVRESLDWFGCYGRMWNKVITYDSFQHPAKFSRNLIERIYEHSLQQGYVKPGDVVGDPFGGVALGAWPALRRGINWVGVELENKFVALGNANLDKWNEEYSASFSPWGVGRLVQGDSRNFAAIVRGQLDVVLSSPPYAASLSNKNTKPEYAPHGLIQSRCYSQEDENLGNMPEGNLDAVIASPPYQTAETRNRTSHNGGHVGDMLTRAYTQDRQGVTEGNLATLTTDDGELSAIVSSPPYANGEKGHPSLGNVNLDEWGKEGTNIAGRRGKDGKYGEEEGQLGAMLEGELEAVISSPPFADSIGSDDPEKRGGLFRDPKRANDVNLTATYGDSEGQLGATAGATFWSASKQIVVECYKALSPGGYAIWVVKGYVKKGQLVDFPEQWEKLCNACGFETVEIARAWLKTTETTQLGMFGENKTSGKTYKSFFRRLAESKGSPRIDYETVIFMRKAAL